MVPVKVMKHDEAVAVCVHLENGAIAKRTTVRSRPVDHASIQKERAKWLPAPKLVFESTGGKLWRTVKPLPFVPNLNTVPCSPAPPRFAVPYSVPPSRVRGPYGNAPSRLLVP